MVNNMAFFGQQDEWTVVMICKLMSIACEHLWELTGHTMFAVLWTFMYPVLECPRINSRFEMHRPATQRMAAAI
jgi:hypothetical protein